MRASATRIAVDVGGTSVDARALDAEGALLWAKVPNTGGDPRAAIAAAIARVTPHGAHAKTLLHRVILPPRPGLVAALGLLAADFLALRGCSVMEPIGQPNLANLALIERTLAALEREVSAELDRERVPDQERQFNRSRFPLRWTRDRTHHPVDAALRQPRDAPRGGGEIS